MGLGIGQASSLPPLPEPALHPCFVSEVIFRPKASSGACLAHVSEQSCFMMQGAHMVEIPLTHPVEQTTGLHEAPDMGWNSVLLIPWGFVILPLTLVTLEGAPVASPAVAPLPLLGWTVRTWMPSLLKCEEWSGSNSRRG